MPAPIPPSDVAGASTATSAWANAVSDAIQQLIADLYPAGALGMSWANISGKPATFAPAVHTHADTAGGGPVGYADISGKPSTFAPTVHVHQSAAATGGQVAYADLTGKPTSLAPTAHTHPYASDITSKPASFTPSDHAISHRTGGSDGLTAAQINGWARAAAGDPLGTKIYVGNGSPSGMAEGDIWIVG